MKSGSITIEDVAKAAGVSRQTVSRVINVQPNVRASVRERVEAAIAEMGYVPNQAARRMGGSRSYIILAAFEKDAVGRTEGRLPLDEMMLAGMRVCAQHGYHLLFEEVDASENASSGTASQQIARALTSLKPDGVVLCPSLEEEADIIDLLGAREIATDYLGQRSEFGRMIPGMDDGFFGETAAEHLLSQGHRQIGFMAGLHDRVRSKRRCEGYRRALVKSGSRSHGHFVSNEALGVEEAFDLARTWLTPTIRPTAIIAETEETARAVLRSAKSLNIPVPAELSILVLDDGAVLSHTEPPLSALHQAYAIHFAAACERLISANTKAQLPSSDDPQSTARDDGFVLVERESIASPTRRR
ncbi:MAG: LacI family DNA-binding transcriptional regulator [Pseudomonadota bacterium]